MPILTVGHIRKLIADMPDSAEVEVDYKLDTSSTRISSHSLKAIKGRGTLLGNQNIIIEAQDYRDCGY